MNNKKLLLKGDSLRIGDLERFLKDKEIFVEISDASKKKILKCKKFLDENIKGKIVYGINTGFGPMASRAIGDKQLKVL